MNIYNAHAVVLLRRPTQIRNRPQRPLCLIGEKALCRHFSGAARLCLVKILRSDGDFGKTEFGHSLLTINEAEVLDPSVACVRIDLQT